MEWDLEKLKEYPEHLHPQNRGYFEPKLEERSLRKKATGR